jgi:hypothetical protein
VSYKNTRCWSYVPTCPAFHSGARVAGSNPSKLSLLARAK